MMLFGLVALVALYCFAKAVIDFKQRRFWWGAAGMMAGIIAISAIIPVQPVSVTIPVAQ